VNGISKEKIEAGIDMEEPDPAKGILSYLKYIIAAQTILFAVIGKPSAVVSRNTGICCEPDEFFAVLENFVNTIGRKPSGCGNMTYKRILSRQVHDGK
jgi:hypothetical protein